MRAIVAILYSVLRAKVAARAQKCGVKAPIVGTTTPRSNARHGRLAGLVAGGVLLGWGATFMEAPVRAGHAIAQRGDEYAVLMPSLTGTSLLVGPSSMDVLIVRDAAPPVPYHATDYSDYTLTGDNLPAFPDAYANAVQPFADTAYSPPLPPELASDYLADGPALVPPTRTPNPPDSPRVTRTIPGYHLPSTLPLFGYATYYNPGVMQEVLANRIGMGQVAACNDCIGYVALLRAGDLNRKVWLQWHDGVVEGPFLVADAAAPHHVDPLLARNWVVDVDSHTATRRGLIGPTWVAVLAEPGQSAVPAAEGNAEAAPTPTATPGAELMLTDDSSVLPVLTD